jgi:hypothetical protein
MPPSDPLRVLFVRVLGLADVQVGAGQEADELLVEPTAEVAPGFPALPEVVECVAVGLVVGRVDRVRTFRG